MGFKFLFTTLNTPSLIMKPWMILALTCSSNNMESPSKDLLKTRGSLQWSHFSGQTSFRVYLCLVFVYPSLISTNVRSYHDEPKIKYFRIMINHDIYQSLCNQVCLLYVYIWELYMYMYEKLLKHVIYTYVSP